HTHTHTHTHASTQTHKHINAYRYTCAHTHTHTVCVFMCMHARMHVFVFMCMHACMHVFVQGGTGQGVLVVQLAMPKLSDMTAQMVEHKALRFSISRPSCTTVLPSADP